MYLCIVAAVAGGIFYIWCIRKGKQKTHGIYGLILLISGVMGILAAVNAASGETAEITNDGEIRIERPSPGSASLRESYELSVEDLEIEESYPIVVENRHLSEQELEELFEEATKELEETFLGENESLDHITQPVTFAGQVCDGRVDVSWILDRYDAVDLNGTLLKESLTEDGTLVGATAEMTYEENQAVHTFSFMVYPPAQTQSEQFFEELTQALDAENASTDTVFSLPVTVGGHKLTWETMADHTPVQILMLGIAAIIAMMIGKKEDARKKDAQRRELLLLQYPKMLGQLSLLIGAGMTVGYAWERMVVSYEKQLAQGSAAAENQPMYEEMRLTYRQMKDGIGERSAYEQFGERLQLPVYRRLSTLLVQNLRKGTAGLSRLLEKEMQDAYDAQESACKKRGEELQTKLLLPMMLMLGLVVVIIMIPALASFQL